MSIKDSALRLASALETELIQIRADQMEAAESLTVRINGVANNLKEMGVKVQALHEEVQSVKASQAQMQGVQTQMLEILVDIQRRLP
ncbi:hypothetical protein AB0D67_10265 [Streptosporangium sp. NPDC048047]|uniref:hypothetical protein n=1 Tax=Streptosporangium sp. NPDC048047 TaxID=3155748 RepID=UPI00342ADD5B